ncbi:Phage protein [Candidatus Syntrophocurvum alkaliphilum]|uniref:Phage protein n=1 Tax=Candidatus Syntrophocurvum alkaliphilum TaxID=2293317 RepID=A0A6I6DBT5_9FIRM|nr:type II toxin-antitoxin system HicB family antitoxin [Candidatus Syntrophocurvum alkaliphilum]QGT99739.1 Phage protein [Candidatus Syntrophocurvum alkaliphilum]
MKNHYIFPAIFSFDTDGIAIEFPDLPGCFTSANSIEEANYMAKDALELHLYSMEEDGDVIPSPSHLTDLSLEKKQRIVLVEVWMQPVRDEMQNKSVKKTLTVPKWLNDIAEENQVNFSHILQSALKQYLGITEKRG